MRRKKDEAVAETAFALSTVWTLDSMSPCLPCLLCLPSCLPCLPCLSCLSCLPCLPSLPSCLPCHISLLQNSKRHCLNCTAICITLYWPVNLSNIAASKIRYDQDLMPGRLSTKRILIKRSRKRGLVQSSGAIGA